jgi:SpoVK/Ycf46/Vps4 family AAA+-type ATPase
MCPSKNNKLINNLDKKANNNITIKIQKKTKFNKILKEIDLDFNENYNNSYITGTNNSIQKNKIIKKEIININTNITNLEDLIKLIDTYNIADNIEYNIDMVNLHKIKPHLLELNSMIGMENLKTNIIDQLLYYIQKLNDFNTDGDFMHTVIYGPPGSGKTEIAKIIGKIFCKIGILKNNTFKKVTRSDLIAGYLGQTALKTRDVIKESLGGVLFIDEAYALGNSEKRDSFSKECIDTLCEGLSDHKNNLMVIVAGYEEELNDCFFSYNPGLQSRFVWRFKTDNYNAEQLMLIFFKKVRDAEWSIADDSNISSVWFEKNIKMFEHYGRSMESLFTKTKIAHSKRVFCLDNKYKKQIILSDLDKGLEMYNVSQVPKEKLDIQNLMYI